MKVLSITALIGLAMTWQGANAATGFLKGEDINGMTKTCYYDVLGNAYTKTVSSVTLCPLTINVDLPPASNPGYSAPPSNSSGTAFKTGERTSGMTKICYYDYLGSEYTKIVSSVSLCPLTIKVQL